MGNQILLPDSLNTIRQTIEVVVPTQNISALDVVYKIATVIIALVNVGLVIYIFFKNSKRDVSHKEKSRKLNLLKTLVLDYSMNYFYDFFRNLDEEVKKLQNKNLGNAGKQAVNENLLSYGKTLEQKFTDLFLGIDQELHKNIKQKIDKLLDGFTENIFNENINIYTDDNFNDLIINKIILSKTQIIKILFNYSGE
jgi:hypothetical protein